MMGHALALVAECRRCGITLRAEEGRLRFKPASAVTPKIRADLAAQKDAILAMLAQTAELGSSSIEIDIEALPAERLGDLDRAVIEASRHIRPDGTFPERMRPRLDLAPEETLRVVNGVEVPAGWTTSGWVERLRYLADACEHLHPDRAAELRAKAAELKRGESESESTGLT